MMSGSSGFYSQTGVSTNASEFNANTFATTQENGELRFAIPVKILKVHGGGVGPAPTVDVQVMINQTDGTGQQTAHTTIYGIAVSRNQGGANVVINDPVVGDTGHLIVSDRDISLFKQSGGKQSNPGSYRVNDLSDGVYVAALCMQVTPNQYIYFMQHGIKIVDNEGNTIVTGSAGVNINGLIIDQSGNLTTPGGVQAGTGTGDSVTLQFHVHPGTTEPVPGT